MFSKTEINTGRQIEFDYLKGWFIPLILLIHSFQLMGGQAAETPAYKVIYIAATMTGSAIFLFVLGLGSTYSKRSAWQQIGYGVKLIILEFLWNALALAAPLLLGMGLRQVASAETNWDAVLERIPMYLQYINIFFIALPLCITSSHYFSHSQCLFAVVDRYDCLRSSGCFCLPL